jgi:hypothetical protein
MTGSRAVDARLVGPEPLHPNVAALIEAAAEAAAEAAVRRVLEALGERATPPALVDAAELARVLGVSRDTVYQHAARLGARRVGDGRRPRLRFDVAQAVAAWTALPSGSRSEQPGDGAAPRNRGGRPRRSTGTGASLLPIRGTGRAA